MCLKIPRITHDEAVSAFIKGLRHHDALRSKLIRKWPSTVFELLATAKNYVDADDAKKIIKKDVGGSSRPEHPPRRDEKPDDRGHNNNRECHDQRNNTIATTEIIVIDGPIIAVITEASAPAKMTMRSTWSRNLLVAMTTKRITTKL
jgi:hypothetical protein